MTIKIKINKETPVSKQISITVEASHMKEAFQEQMLCIQKEVQLPGFRKGYAPLDTVRKEYTSQIRERTRDQVMKQAIDHAIEKHQWKRIFVVQVEKIALEKIQEDQPLSFQTTIEQLPEIKLQKYRGIKLSASVVHVEEKDVQGALETLRKQRAELIPYLEEDHAVVEADVVEAEIQAYEKNETEKKIIAEFSGKRTLKVQDYKDVISYEKELIGSKKGDRKIIDRTFPKKNIDPKYAGKQIVFEIEIKNILKEKLPILDDAFAKQFGIASLEQLKEEVLKSLKIEKDRKQKEQLEEELLKKLLEAHSFEVPLSLVQDQTRVLVQDWAMRLTQAHWKQKQIEEELKKRISFFQAQADKVVRADFLLDHIAEKEKVVLTLEEIDQSLSSLAFSQKRSKEDVRKELQSKKERWENFLLTKKRLKVMDFLMQEAEVEKMPQAT